jgi:hypothetical protein
MIPTNVFLKGAGWREVEQSEYTNRLRKTKSTNELMTFLRSCIGKQVFSNSDVGKEPKLLTNKINPTRLPGIPPERAEVEQVSPGWFALRRSVPHMTNRTLLQVQGSADVFENSTCTLPREFECERSAGCNYVATKAGDVFLRDEDGVFVSYSEPHDYQKGPCLESRFGRLDCMDPTEFVDMVTSAYGDDPPLLIVLNMCDSNIVAQRLHNHFLKMKRPVTLVFWGTLADDQSAMFIFKEILVGLADYLGGRATLDASTIGSLPVIARYMKTYSIGNPLTSDEGSKQGTPFILLGHDAENIRPGPRTPPRVPKSSSYVPGSAPAHLLGRKSLSALTTGPAQHQARSLDTLS